MLISCIAPCIVFPLKTLKFETVHSWTQIPESDFKNRDRGAIVRAHFETLGIIHSGTLTSNLLVKQRFLAHSGVKKKLSGFFSYIPLYYISIFTNTTRFITVKPYLGQKIPTLKHVPYSISKHLFLFSVSFS